MRRCEIFGHKFRPRYDEERTVKGFGEWMGAGVKISLVFPIDMQEMATKLVSTKQTYVCDVCVRCGEKK